MTQKQVPEIENEWGDVGSTKEIIEKKESNIRLDKISDQYLEMRMSDPLSGNHFPWASVKIAAFFSRVCYNQMINEM